MKYLKRYNAWADRGFERSLPKYEFAWVMCIVLPYSLLMAILLTSVFISKILFLLLIISMIGVYIRLAIKDNK